MSHVQYGDIKATVRRCVTFNPLTYRMLDYRAKWWTTDRGTLRASVSPCGDQWHRSIVADIEKRLGRGLEEVFWL
jgi:hypothetical protein